jgi:hypothetical protein
LRGFPANAGAGQEDYLDAGGDAPAGFTVEAKGGEGFGEWVAEAEAVKDVERYGFWVVGIDGLGEELQGTPSEDRAPHGGGGELRTGTGKDATGGGGPGSWEQGLDGRNPHGRAETLAEGWAE